jgi:hypothetical protein
MAPSFLGRRGARAAVALGLGLGLAATFVAPASASTDAHHWSRLAYGHHAGSADKTAPVLLSVHVRPHWVDVTMGDGSVKVTAVVLDRGAVPSGVSSVVVTITQITDGTGQPVTGATALPSVALTKATSDTNKRKATRWSGTLTLPKGSAPGLYVITSVVAKDASGNDITLSAKQCRNVRGWGGFWVVNTADPAPTTTPSTPTTTGAPAA